MENNNKKIVSVILARAGSKGIPKKNIKKLTGKPLIAYNIEAAKNSKYIQEVYVSTDGDEIARISKNYGATVINRPSKFATDQASSELALVHFAENVDFDVLVFLQCTSPFTQVEDIDGAIEEFFCSYDTLLSVCEDHGGFLCGGFTWNENGESIGYDYKNRPRRQDMGKKYRENGAIYIMSRKGLLENKNRLHGGIGLYVMPRSRSFEIDEPEDFEIAGIFMRNNKTEASSVGGLSKIKMAIFDVDGIFTDGSVYTDKKGNEQVRFSRIDGKGIELLRNAGVEIAVLSSEDSVIVAERMKKLKINNVYLGVKDKMSVYTQLKEKYKLKNEEICFCGDDVQDIEVLKTVGFSACPKNGQKSVKKACKYVSKKYGGDGFVREISMLILDAKE